MENKEEQEAIISIEGFETEEGIRIKYKLPKITSDEIVDFYRIFISQLCERIAQLEGADLLFNIVEDDSE